MSAWLSAQSSEAQALLALSVIWLAGFIMSRATKAFGLPNVTGYILAGVVIGPYCLDLLPSNVTGAMSFITDTALALIAFGVGRYISVDHLRGQGKKVILLTLMESLVAAVIVTLVMLAVFRLPLSFSLLLGAIASATAPASSLMTIRQYKAKGVFVNTLIQVVAMDDAVSLLAFSLCAAIAAQTDSAATLESVLLPLALNIAVLIGSYLLGRLLCLILQGRSTDHRVVLTCAFITVIAGACAALDISPLLGCMVLGATVMNFSHDKPLFKQMTRVSPPINMMFFVLSGMRLNLSALTTVGIIGVTYFAVRIVGKYLGAWWGAKITHSPVEVQRYLGLALIPQAGVSIGLAVLAQRILPEESGMLLSTIILSSSVLYEMIGPLCAKRALVLSGAIHPSALPVLSPEGRPLNPPERTQGKKAAQAPAAPAQDSPEAEKAKAALRKPVKSDKALKAEAPEKAVREEPKDPKSAKSAKPLKNEKSDKPDKAEKTEKTDKKEKASAVKQERPQKKDKKGEKSEKGEKGEKTEKGEKAPAAPAPVQEIERPAPEKRFALSRLTRLLNRQDGNDAG